MHRIAPSLVRSPGRLAAVALAALLAAACSEEAGAPARESAPAPRIERDSAPAAVALRQALDDGDVVRAEELLAGIGPRLGAEAPALRARLAFLRGDREGWLRNVEEARALAPRDPRPYATAAELWAADGRLEAAEAEIARGVAAAGGLTPELERAKGVLAIVTPGGARVGLELLERARARDPELPFIARALGQAHLLAAKASAHRDPPGALASVEASLAHDPNDPDALELHAQLLYANERIDDAIEAYERLLRAGRDVRVELSTWHKNAGLLAQVRGEAEPAIAHYLRARELGASDAQLATGAHFLRARASELVARAFELLDAETAAGAGARGEGGESGASAESDASREGGASAASGAGSESGESGESGEGGAGGDGLAEVRRLARLAETYAPGADDVRELAAELLVRDALAAFARDDRVAANAACDAALERDPGHRLARVLRAKVRFADARFAEAAADFRRVIDDARLAGLELPEPIHLHLSECLDVTADRERALAVLREYIDEEPEGRWLEATRARLRELGG